MQSRIALTTCEDSVVLEVVDDYLGIYGLTLSQKLLEQSQYGRESPVPVKYF